MENTHRAIRDSLLLSGADQGEGGHRSPHFPTSLSNKLTRGSCSQVGSGCLLFKVSMVSDGVTDGWASAHALLSPLSGIDVPTHWGSWLLEVILNFRCLSI